MRRRRAVKSRRGAAHRLQIPIGGGAEQLHDLHEVLLRRVLPLERQVAQQQLHEDRADRPD
eukprot:249565-Prymnesium_polylepis.1